MTLIKDATSKDAKAIAALWTPYILNSDVTFNAAPKTPAMITKMLAEKAAANHPFRIATDSSGALLGFATYGQFRASNGYARTMEHTVILDETAKGSGVGRTLMSDIEAIAKAAGVHSMFAGVSARNPDGIAFHQAIGYHEVARLKEVGYKRDQFYDLVLLQKFL